MGKIYCDNICKPDNDVANGIFLHLALLEREHKEQLSESDFKNWIIEFHNQVRAALNLPNKLFTFITFNNDKESQIALFPREPDGNYYTAKYDEDTGQIYILIDLEKS